MAFRTNIYLLLVLISCSSEQKERNSNNEESEKSVVQVQQIDVCALRRHSIDTLSTLVMENTELILSSIKNDPNNEECIFDVIDKLASSTNNGDSSLFAIEKLYKLSDGFLSEYLMEVAVLMFNQNLSRILTFIDKHENSNIEKSIVDGLSMELSMEGSDKSVLLRETLSKTEVEKEKQILKNLFSKIDPERFD